MLTFDSTQRISAESAINHRWIKNKVNETVDTKATLVALGHLRTFRVKIYIDIFMSLFIG
mgnify:CR=1 FL=1|jgi:hypothetical protein